MDGHRPEVAPVFRETIPRAESTEVTVTEVHPLRDFGGSGDRLRGGGLVGLGPAVRVAASRGEPHVIAAPDADDLAAEELRPAGGPPSSKDRKSVV